MLQHSCFCKYLCKLIFRYEKSSDYEKDKHIRNITSTCHNGKPGLETKSNKECKENKKNLTIQNQNRTTLLNSSGIDSAKKPPQSPTAKHKNIPNAQSTTKSSGPRTTTSPPKEVVVQPQQKSWRERVAEKEEAETRTTQNNALKTTAPPPEEFVLETLESTRKSWRERRAEKEKEDKKQKEKCYRFSLN